MPKRLACRHHSSSTTTPAPAPQMYAQGSKLFYLPSNPNSWSSHPASPLLDSGMRRTHLRYWTALPPSWPTYSHSKNTSIHATQARWISEQSCRRLITSSVNTAAPATSQNACKQLSKAPSRSASRTFHTYTPKTLKDRSSSMRKRETRPVKSSCSNPDAGSNNSVRNSRARASPHPPAGPLGRPTCCATS